MDVTMPIEALFRMMSTTNGWNTRRRLCHANASPSDLLPMPTASAVRLTRMELEYMNMFWRFIEMSLPFSRNSLYTPAKVAERI